MDEEQCQRLQKKHQAENDTLVRKARLTDDGSSRPKGLPLPRNQIDQYLLSHQLHTGCRIKEQHGAAHQLSSTRRDYGCYQYEHCPFHLIRLDYIGFPDVSFLQIKKPHIHISGKQLLMKRTTYCEISTYIRSFRAQLPARELYQRCVSFVREALLLDDPIGELHRSQFPQFQLGQVDAFAVDVHGLLPNMGEFHKRISYYRKVDGQLNGHILTPTERQPRAAMEGINTLAEQAQQPADPDAKAQLSMLHRVLNERPTE